jgi:hypothetical protein
MSIMICVQLSALPGREQSLESYEDQVLGLLGEHQGQVIARLQALDGPVTEIQVLEFESDRSLAAFQGDPRRLALSELREASIASTIVTRVRPIG